MASASISIRRGVDQGADRGESVAGGGAAANGPESTRTIEAARTPFAGGARQDRGRRLPGARPRGDSEAAAGLRAGRLRRYPERHPRCAEECRRRGIEILVLDQTPTRRRAPGRAGRRAGASSLLGPVRTGRLYDVPVQQGWLSSSRPGGRVEPVRRPVLDRLASRKHGGCRTSGGPQGDAGRETDGPYPIYGRIPGPGSATVYDAKGVYQDSIQSRVAIHWHVRTSSSTSSRIRRTA